MYAFSLGSFFICKRRKKMKEKILFTSESVSKVIQIKFVIKLAMLFLMRV